MNVHHYRLHLIRSTVGTPGVDGDPDHTAREISRHATAAEARAAARVYLADHPAATVQISGDTARGVCVRAGFPMLTGGLVGTE